MKYYKIHPREFKKLIIFLKKIEPLETMKQVYPMVEEEPKFKRIQYSPYIMKIKKEIEKGQHKYMTFLNRPVRGVKDEVVGRISMLPTYEQINKGKLIPNPEIEYPEYNCYLKPIQVLLKTDMKDYNITCEELINMINTVEE